MNRFSYFYDTATPCNKRRPGEGCSAIAGFNRAHAILGASEYCIATHPSDMCVALAALEPLVHVTGPDGSRSIPFGELHRLPGTTPHVDTNLRPGELITALDLPAKGFAEHHAYLKVRERASYAFALVSVAAALEVEGGRIREARLALGGVAHKPWRDPEAETLLHDQEATRDSFQRAAEALARKIEGSPLAGLGPRDLTCADGHIHSRRDPARQLALTDVMRRGDTAVIEKRVAVKPSRRQARYSRYAHSAVFAEARVDEDFGTVRVPRVVSAVARGRILNPKTARSQVLGGVVWGLGMALEEESVIDHAFGRFMNHNLAEYHVPVNADVQDIEVIFVEERDEIVNPLGAKGLGEIGLVGTAAAIANAVFHATGRRIRDLPITPDKLSAC